MILCSYHRLSYFHLNDVFIDVVPIVLTRHAVVDVILTQVVLTGEKHTNSMTTVSKHNLNSKDEPFLPLNLSDSWEALSSHTDTSSLSLTSPTWRVVSVFGKGDSVPNVHKPPLSYVIEWHSPLMCLCRFGTQLANWPLIRQAASRAQTVTVERSVFWEPALHLPLSCKSNYCLGHLLRRWRSLSRNSLWQWARIDVVNNQGALGRQKRKYMIKYCK